MQQMPLVPSHLETHTETSRAPTGRGSSRSPPGGLQEGFQGELLLRVQAARPTAAADALPTPHGTAVATAKGTSAAQ